MPCCHPLPHHRRLSIAVGLSLDRLSPSRPGSQINRAVVEKDLDNQLRNGGRRTTAGRKRRFLVPSDLLGFDGLHAWSENDLLVRRHLAGSSCRGINGRRCGCSATCCRAGWAQANQRGLFWVSTGTVVSPRRFSSCSANFSSPVPYTISTPTLSNTEARTERVRGPRTRRRHLRGHEARGHPRQWTNDAGEILVAHHSHDKRRPFGMPAFLQIAGQRRRAFGVVRRVEDHLSAGRA